MKHFVKANFWMGVSIVATAPFKMYYGKFCTFKSPLIFEKHYVGYVRSSPPKLIHVGSSDTQFDIA